MSKIIVTGGAGFIGSHIAERYLAEGHEVVIFDNLSTGNKDYIPPDADFRLIDLKDEQAILDTILEIKPDVINHHAAQINVRASLEDPVTDARENILGGLNVLKGAIKAEVGRIIFASTGGAIYGSLPVEELPISEAGKEMPESPYGAAKLAMEHYIRVLFGLENIPYVILRYANVYGPRQVIKGESGVVAVFTQRLLDGIQPVIFGDGSHTRDYVYVKDVVKANVSALTMGDYGTFNIGTTTRIDVNEVFERISALLPDRIEPIHGDEIPGEVEHVALDYSLAKETLGWKPDYTMDRGIPETLEYYQSQKLK
jgi:UDP-glucose 4-epimerase